jgi:hypothetical protein
MSETVTETPSEVGPPGSSVSTEGEDATKPLQNGAEASDAGEHDDKPAPDAEEERKRTERRREAQRIGYLTKQRYAEKARADALEQQLREMQARINPNGAQQPSQEELERAIDRAAEQKLAAKQHAERFNAWDSKGVEEFGSDRFRDACKTVADMASDDQRRLLVDVALDTENGHRAIMELADNPDEAERILALPPHKMALALAKLGEPAPAKPVAVSNTPAPIRPPAVGRARGEPDPEKGDMSAYMRWSAKQNWRR